MTITDVDIARWRLRSQRLVGEGRPDAESVVRELLCVQAENQSQSAWAVAARTVRPDPADLDAGLADGRVLRTHVIRPTWHYVTPDDLVWLLDLTAPRVRATFATQLEQLHGLDPARVERLGGLIADGLRGGHHLTRAEIADLLNAQGHDLTGMALMVLLGDLEQQQVVCSGAPVEGVHTYALLEERIPRPRRLDREEGLAEIALRYVGGHGPATVRDLAYWATLTPTDAKAGFAAVADQLATFEHDGRTYWHLPDEEPPTGPAEPTGHLLQVLDEMYRGFQDSRMVIDAAGAVPRAREAAIGMVLHDGQLVAAMKRSVSARAVTFELRPYPSWRARMRRDVDVAAAAYGSYLGLEPRLKLP
ncbi:winged helix DNA-binding domain-containing protein [Nocardioides sp.]|uniref:winged helix DNA-binding domain-containing protein n=1 Tax=Nocardioides sp. TaxID=35761 RepID=UPI002ECFFD91